MKSIRKFEPGGYYLFESLSSGRSCYFESEDEVDLFKRLLKRYLFKYLQISKIYVSSEGYQVTVRVRTKETILKHYGESCEKKGKQEREEFVKEPWRIISEQMRQFMSLYVRAVNRKRGREGVLVKHGYNRYYFESEEEYNRYESEMDEGKEVRSQKEEDYSVSERWRRRVNWGVLRGKDWVESLMDKGFKDLVVSNLIKFTLNAHIP